MENSNKKTFNLVEAVIKGIEEKKGNNILTLKFTPEISSICDYFIICDAQTDRQVKAISESVVEVVQNEIGIKPRTIEGRATSQWILMDYFDVIVHIFQEETREFYALEKLWADAEKVKN